MIVLFVGDKQNTHLKTGMLTPENYGGSVTKNYITFKMVFKPLSLLEFNTETKEWGKRRFETFTEYHSFIKSMLKFPGEYNFKNTEYWNPMARKFAKDKRYTDYALNSKEYRQFWLTERRKCEQGIIVDGVWISPDLYFFWNFCPIFNKIEMTTTHPDIWDGHYHYDLYLQLAWLEDQDGGCTKARQKGISLYHMARIAKRGWFGDRATLKVVGFEEAYLQGEWEILQNYRDHLNEHTGWYRNFQPDETFNWQFKREITEGTINKKKVTKGNKSKIKASITKRNFSKAVGGPALEVYATEAGIYQNLKKVKEYVDPNIKFGSVKTGMFVAAGAVGELKDAEDLKEMSFNPKAYNIRPVEDKFSGSMEPIAFFFPDEWNYAYKDEITGKVVKCYDQDGNSNLELAYKYLDIEEQNAKKKDESSYKLWKSQHPRTLQEAFDQREDNPFPTTMLKEQELSLIKEKPVIVSFYRDEKGKVKHKFANDVPVAKLKPNPHEDNRGAVIIRHMPVENPPEGLYFAGIDPIWNTDTSTSKSLMSITVWMGTHERDGKYVEPYPVATYTGRHKKPSETYQICLDLIEFYNARVAVESNVKDFIEWVIRQGKSRFLMRRRELIVIQEMMPNSTIRDEIGVRMEGEFKKRCIDKMVTWMENIYSTEFNLETGESKDLYNVKKIWDTMFIKECLQYTTKLNTDRLVANCLALIAAQSYTNRHIINTLKDANNTKSPKTISRLPSHFHSRTVSPVGSHFKNVKGHFGKR